MIFLDVETCGFYGMPVLLQYAINNGEIYLYEIWRNTVGETLDLIESIANHPEGIVGFNLVFDWFHINKLYNVFRLLPREYYPDEHVEEIACLEKRARDGVCVLPQKACDLFLHARKGVYQSTLDRKDIRIKRVPKELAQSLANELNKRITFNKLYFARRKEQLANPWQVFESKNMDKTVDPDFRDIVLKFSPSSGLKALAVDALGVDENELLKFDDVSVHPKFYPEEKGWFPCAEAIGEPGNWRRSWPDVIEYHIDHWAYSKNGREYARRDVEYTRGLYEFFERPEAGDDDSELSCSIAAARWKGFAVDIEKIKALRAAAIDLSESAPKSPNRVKEWIWPHLEEDEKATTEGSTGKKALEAMLDWTNECEHCQGEGRIESESGDVSKCTHCNKGRIVHPAATKAKMVLDARKAKKEIELYDKIIEAGRLHASFKVIGTLSGRLAGADKLNMQAVKSTKEVRGCFPLAFAEEGEELCGGDFESFEVYIAVSVYDDPKLEAELDSYGTCPGCLGSCKVQNKKTGEIKDCSECLATGKCKRKLHGIFGEVLYKMNYDEIVATKGSKVKDYYRDSKVGVFSQLYGGDHNTLRIKLQLDESAAKEGADLWAHKYPGIRRAQKRIMDMFQSMRQPNGIGTKVEWHSPAEYVSSLLDFRRYYTMENRICKVLFDLAEHPLKDWTNLKITVRRRDRDQTVSGAVRSALFGSAFGIQSANVRSATNHEIQATGAQICKHVQRKINDLQPRGISPWVIRSANIHDEVLVVTRPEKRKEIGVLVKEEVAKFKYLIPRIAIDWSDKLETWADK